MASVCATTARHQGGGLYAAEGVSDNRRAAVVSSNWIPAVAATAGRGTAGVGGADSDSDAGARRGADSCASRRANAAAVRAAGSANDRIDNRHHRGDVGAHVTTAGARD